MKVFNHKLKFLKIKSIPIFSQTFESKVAISHKKLRNSINNMKYLRIEITPYVNEKDLL